MRSTAATFSERSIRWLTLILVASIGLATSAPAAKFDLGPYQGPAASVGDFRLYELSTGGTRLLEVVEVAQWKKGVRVSSRVSETGLEPAVVDVYVIPGKKVLIGDGFSAGLLIDLKKPKTMFKVRAKPGKINRFRAGGRAFLDGVFIGKAKYKGAWVFTGLGPLPTPAASFGDTALVDMVLSLTIKDVLFGDVIEAITEQASWSARGLGNVATSQRTTLWVNGVMADDTGWVDAWLIDGSVGGVPVP